MNIHLICRGNVLRSLIAETYLKSLNLNNINVISSGTNVDWSDETEKEYFANTVALLTKHGIQFYAKTFPQQLTQQRIDNQDITICMNQRVVDEALKIVKLPDNVINWNVIDIGEGARVVEHNREVYEEEIYKEVTDQVNKLVKQKLTNVNK